MSQPTVLMLLTNAYDPDPRVRQEALSLIGMGCHVRLLAWDRDRKCRSFEIMEGVQVERVFVDSRHGRGATQIFFYAWVYWLMLWRALRTRYDIVHCHDLDTLPMGVVVSALKRRPLVYDAHESFPDMLQGSVRQGLRRILAALENVLMRRADLVITVGERLRRHLADRGAAHSVVVGNWKSRREFTRSADEVLSLRQRLGVPAEGLLVVCITQLLRDRKLEELIAATDTSDGVYLVIAGRGVLEPTVRAAAQANRRIIFPGHLTAREIADYTCAADAIYYGFDPGNPNARFSAPNKLFEALAAGRPLITGDFGEIADVVRANGCGIVLPEYSAATIRAAFETLKDASTCQSMAEKARVTGAINFSWEQGEDVLYREYSRLVSGLRQPSRNTTLEPDGIEAVSH